MNAALIESLTTEDTQQIEHLFRDAGYADIQASASQQGCRVSQRIAACPLWLPMTMPMPGPMLSFTELWLLELAIAENQGDPIALNTLVETRKERSAQGNFCWNMPYHGMNVRQLSKVLWQLAQADRVQLRLQSDRSGSLTDRIPESWWELRHALLRETILWRRADAGRGQAASLRCYYSVTPKGLADWEAYAEPDWRRYANFHEEYGEAGDSDIVWRIKVQTAEVGLEYLLLDLQNPDRNYMTQVDWPTLSVSDLSDWEPICGKVFPRASMVSVRVRRTPCEEWNGLTLAECEREREYYDTWSRVRRWYRNGVDNYPPHLTPLACRRPSTC